MMIIVIVLCFFGMKGLKTSNPKVNERSPESKQVKLSKGASEYKAKSL